MNTPGTVQEKYAAIADEHTRYSTGTEYAAIAAEHARYEMNGWIDNYLID